MNSCKVCGGKIVLQCKCLRGDATCEKGHSYHFSPYHNEYHLGKADHSIPFDSPDCCSDKKKI